LLLRKTGSNASSRTFGERQQGAAGCRYRTIRKAELLQSDGMIGNLRRFGEQAMPGGSDFVQSA